MSSGIRLMDLPMASDRNEAWRLVRAAGDVVQGSDGVWLLTSPEAIQYALRNHRLFSSARAFDGLMSPVPLIPLAIDRPDHKRFRRILDPMLAPAVINTMENELREQIRELVRDFADKGQCDIVTDLARVYPVQVFLTLFGLPLSDTERFLGWVEPLVEKASISGEGEPDEELVEAAMGLFAYLQEQLEIKRAKPDTSMLGRIVSLQGEDAWKDEEILGLCFLFTLAGLDTVTAAIGFLMLHLAQRPELQQQLAATPELAGAIVEEALRLELPAPTVPRVTTADVVVCGTAIPAGSRVEVCLATFNRDLKRFPAGDDMEPDQAGSAHLGFGGGIHKCLGSHLARRELLLVVQEFHRLIPQYQLAPGAAPKVIWPSGTMRLDSLPLVFTPSRE
jgi:cytochrome P450